MPELPGIIDPSVGTFEGELRNEPTSNFLEIALRKFVRKKPLYPGGPTLDLGDIVETMDPEIRNAVMGFGPGQLPTAAGTFTSNIVNAINKHFKEFYPQTGGHIHAARVMEMLRDVPQSVMDRVEKFVLTGERPKYYAGGGAEKSALGVFHPYGKRENIIKGAPEPVRLEEMAKESPRLMPEIEVQGVNIPEWRSGRGVASTVIHEFTHNTVAAIKRMLGQRAAMELEEHGIRDPLYSKWLTGPAGGREEPIARKMEAATPEEFLTIFKPYFDALKESLGVRIFGAAERTNVDKAIRRARERMQKGKARKHETKHESIVDAFFEFE